MKSSITLKDIRLKLYHISAVKICIDGKEIWSGDTFAELDKSLEPYLLENPTIKSVHIDIVECHHTAINIETEKE